MKRETLCNISTIVDKSINVTLEMAQQIATLSELNGNPIMDDVITYLRMAEKIARIDMPKHIKCDDDDTTEAGNV